MTEPAPNSAMPPKLGILAGGGELPRLLIDACRSEGRDFHVVAFRGHAQAEAIAGAPQDWVRLGAVADTLRALRAAGAEELVFAGRIARPSLTELQARLARRPLHCAYRRPAPDRQQPA